MKYTAIFCVLLIASPAALAINLKGKSNTMRTPKKDNFISIKLNKKEQTTAQRRETINFITKTQQYFLSSQ